MSHTVVSGVLALKGMQRQQVQSQQHKNGTDNLAVLDDDAEGFYYSAGYFWVDGSAHVTFLTPNRAITTSSGIPVSLTAMMEDVGMLSNAFATKSVSDKDARAGDAISDDDEEGEIDEDYGDEEGEGRIIRSHMISRLFPTPAYASASLTDVFGKFLDILSDKPLGSTTTTTNKNDNDNGVAITGSSTAAEEERLIESIQPAAGNRLAGVIARGSGTSADLDEDAIDEDEDEEDISMQDLQRQDQREPGEPNTKRNIFANMPERDFDVVVDEVENREEYEPVDEEED